MSELVKKSYTIKIPKTVTVTQYEEAQVTLNEYIGTTIKTLREKKNLTPAQLAAEVGRSTTNINTIEAGATNTQFNTLVNIAGVLECHITDLFPPKEEENAN